VGSFFTITAPNFRKFPVQPNYEMRLGAGLRISPAGTGETGKFVYFDVDRRFVAVILANLRLEF